MTWKNVNTVRPTWSRIQSQFGCVFFSLYLSLSVCTVQSFSFVGSFVENFMLLLNHARGHALPFDVDLAWISSVVGCSYVICIGYSSIVLKSSRKTMALFLAHQTNSFSVFLLFLLLHSVCLFLFHLFVRSFVQSIDFCWEHFINEWE